MLSLKRKIKKFFWKNSGYTTIELLIAMQLTFMVIGLAYSSYLFSRNLVRKWQDKIGVEAQLAVLSKTLSEHFWQIRQILQADATHLLALEISGDSLQLLLNGQLYMNDNSLVIFPLKLKEGKLCYFLTFESSGEIIQRSGQIDSTETFSITAVQLELCLSGQDREYPFILCCRLPQSRLVIPYE